MLMALSLSRAHSELDRYLHVAREHHEIATLPSISSSSRFFLPCLVGWIDRQVMKRNVVGCRKLIEVAMVRNDRRDDDRQGAGAIAEQQIVEAVSELRHHDEHTRLHGRIVQMPLHTELFADRRKRALQFLQAPACRDREYTSHEETLVLRIAELRCR